LCFLWQEEEGVEEGSSSWPSSTTNSSENGDAGDNGDSEGPTSTSSRVVLGESFELLLEEAAPSILAWGHSTMQQEEEEEERGEREGEGLRGMGGSFMALGRTLRTKDSILSAPPPSCTTPVNEEVRRVRQATGNRKGGRRGRGDGRLIWSGGKGWWVLAGVYRACV
jgi:hypothetical protein